MKIRKRKNQEDRFLILKENESITILADLELKSAIKIVCKNKKLIIECLDTMKKPRNRNEFITEIN